MVDTSYLDEDDLADPGIRANVQAMTETNERVRWAAEAEGEAAFGYWQAVDGDPVVVVSLDSEGQYMVVPGRNITEALCASVAEFDDDEFAALASRARELAAETAPGIASTLVEASSIAELPSPAVEGPGKFRDARYRALREADTSQPSGTDDAGEPANDATQDSASARGATGWDPALDGLPQDLTRWRERAAAGETAPWDRFGVRFLAAGETPSEVARALNDAAESGDRWALASAEATRLTAERATWVVEDGEGRSLGYWHGANDTPIGAASIGCSNLPRGLVTCRAARSPKQCASTSASTKTTRSPSSLRPAGSSDSTCRATGSMTFRATSQTAPAVFTTRTREKPKQQTARKGSRPPMRPQLPRRLAVTPRRNRAPASRASYSH